MPDRRKPYARSRLYAHGSCSLDKRWCTNRNFAAISAYESVEVKTKGDCLYKEAGGVIKSLYAHMSYTHSLLFNITELCNKMGDSGHVRKFLPCVPAARLVCSLVAGCALYDGMYSRPYQCNALLHCCLTCCSTLLQYCWKLERCAILG